MVYPNEYIGIVCTISGTVITAGTTGALTNVNGTGKVIRVVALSDSKVFVAHNGSSTSYSLYGIVCAISGTTISTGADTVLNSNSYMGHTISLVKLDENKVFIAHSADSSFSLNGIVCTITGFNITKGTDTQLNSLSNTGFRISAVALNKNRVVITHSGGNTQSSVYLYSMQCDIDETTITKGTDVQLSSVQGSGRAISATALIYESVFIAHSYSTSYYLYGMVLGYLTNLVQAVKTKNEVINGVAITSGQDGETVQVKVPGEE